MLLSGRAANGRAGERMVHVEVQHESLNDPPNPQQAQRYAQNVVASIPTVLRSTSMDGLALIPCSSGTAITNLAFDYASLPPHVADKARKAANRIKHRLHRHVREIAEIGHDLQEIKDQLDHGQFGEWLEAEFEMSDRTAARYMRVGQIIGDKIDTVSNLPLRVVYLLIAPKTPEPVRLEIMRRLDAGEPVEESDVRLLVADHLQQVRTEILLPIPAQTSTTPRELEHLSHLEPDTNSGSEVARSELSRQQTPHAAGPMSDADVDLPEAADEVLTDPSWVRFANLLSGLFIGLGELCTGRAQELLEDLAKTYLEGFSHGLRDHEAGKDLTEPPTGSGSTYLSGWDRGWIVADRASPHSTPQQQGQIEIKTKAETEVDAF
jgi:hypothetical protein